jgi:NADH:ubiquinone oxidoreductase subunit K
MNKVLFFVLLTAALMLGSYNLYLIDYSDLFADQNFVASVSAIAALAAAVLLAILFVSKKIEEKSKR